jgi:photosystem II stability/assembly factor-like uncharacterized protein
MRRSIRWCGAVMVLALAATVAAKAEDWQPVGPPGGDVESLSAVPGGTQVLFIGTSDGHVFRSDDGGTHWFEVGRVAPSGDHVVTAIVVDPRSHSTLLASSWELSGTGGGVWRSRDGGHTWEAAGLQGHAVRALAAAPSNPDLLVAGAVDGVFRSRDAGRTWERISPEGRDDLVNFDSIAIDPRDPNTIYAGTFHLPWKTTDGGATWNPIHTGMVEDSDVMSLSVDPRDPDHIFASACSGIYSSHNGGLNWVKFKGIPNTSRRTVHLVQDPQNPLTIYAATTLGLWKTTDDGATWHVITPDTWSILSILIDPEHSDRVILGTERMGIEISADGGETYRVANDGFSHRRIADLATDPAHPGWALVVLTNAVEPVLETRDAGRTWTSLANGLKFGPPRRVFSSPGGWLAAPAPGGLLHYDEAQSQWIAANEVIEKPAASPHASPHSAGASSASRNSAASSPRATKVAATAKPAMIRTIVPLHAVVNDVAFSNDAWFAATDSGLYVSRDRGATWIATLLPTHPGDPARAVRVHDAAVWVVTPHLLAISTDSGKTWDARTLPVEARAGSHFEMSADGSAYLASDHGLFISHDAGSSWRQSPLPELVIEDLIVTRSSVLVTTPNGLYLSTDSGRMWSALETPPSESETVVVRSAGTGEELLAASPTEGLYRAAITSLSAPASASRDADEPTPRK